MAIITPTGDILDQYRYNVTLDVFKRSAPTVHLTNLRFRLWRRDPDKAQDVPVDDTHIPLADETGLDSPITFPISATTDYFIRITKSGYHTSERNLTWRISTEQFRFMPLIYGEGHGIIQGPNLVYAEEIAPGGIFPEEYLDRWGRFQILMDPAAAGPGTGEGILILDKGFGIKTLACSGKYTFNDTTGDWDYVDEAYTNTKVADMTRYLQYHYPDIPLIWIATYEEWATIPPSQRYLTFYPSWPGKPGTPESNENNFQMWIEDENSNMEAEAFEYYIDINDPLVQDRYQIEYK